MNTPKFIQIAIARAQYTETILGLTAEGEVFEWDGTRWIKLENPAK